MFYIMLIAKRLLNDLMENQAYQKRKICDLMIRHGVDISTVLNSNFSDRVLSNLAIMYSAGPMHFVQDFAHQNIGLQDYWSMDPVNSWILRSLARSDPRFSAKLRSQEQDLRYSSHPKFSKKKNQGLDFSIETQLKEMERSSSIERQLYIIAICAGGPASELDPLLMHPKEIPELDISKDKGVRARNYLDISNACGNIEIFCRLLDAGADCYSHQERIWKQLSKKHKVPTHFSNLPENRTRMTTAFLSKVSTNLPETSTPMIVPDGIISSVSRLSFWLSCWVGKTKPIRLQTNAALSDRVLTGSFVAAATIAENVSALTAFVRNGFDLEWEDEDGFTPLMIALAQGSTISAQILIDAGADLEQPKSCELSVSELASKVFSLLKSPQYHDKFNSDSKDYRLSEIFKKDNALKKLFQSYSPNYGYLDPSKAFHHKKRFCAILKLLLEKSSASLTSTTELALDYYRPEEDKKEPEIPTENGEFHPEFYVESKK
jgi:ankyrin repeat protein